MKPIVLLLSTYPAITPRHGGQVRLSNIADSYAKAGFQVEHMAIYEPEGYNSQPRGKRDIPFPSNSPYRKFRGKVVPLINDLLSGAFAAAEDGCFTDVCNRLPAQINAIHVEQPWLWPLAVKIRKQPAFKNASLIYGSQNIEAPLKTEILETYNVDKSDIQNIEAEICHLEKSASKEADITIAVTTSDLQILTQWGAKKAILASNGIAPWKASVESLAQWEQRLPKAPWALYIASAHPPNFTGFAQCFGNSLACIPPDTRLVVAGSVCDHLYQQLAQSQWNQLNTSRIELLGVLSDEDLAAVKTLAHAFVLPIPHGGGSNIKAAEALYSGAYVIGTKAAFRGFEQHIALPGITASDNPNKFVSALRSALVKPRLAVNKENKSELGWAQCLAIIPATLQQLLKGASIK